MKLEKYHITHNGTIVNCELRKIPDTPSLDDGSYILTYEGLEEENDSSNNSWSRFIIRKTN